jgi:hypothetical protein
MIRMKKKKMMMRFTATKRVVDADRVNSVSALWVVLLNPQRQYLRKPSTLERNNENTLLASRRPTYTPEVAKCRIF